MTLVSAVCLITDMGLIHSGYSEQRNSQGIAGATEKDLGLQATQGSLLKLMLIKIIYNTTISEETEWMIGQKK